MTMPRVHQALAHLTYRRRLTTTHVAQLAFGTTRAATARMLTLYQHQATDRFRPLATTGDRELALDKSN